VLGFLAESFVFAYLGLTIFSFSSYSWSWQFILVEMVVIMIGRYTGIVALLYFMVMCGHRPKTTFKETLFISYAGLIRGPIAFGLVLTIDKST
jgi:NhaP-type Na+/H+ or K+/H+ antiporter